MTYELQLRDAKATLSAVVDHAVCGEPTVVTRHGRPAAVVVGFADWERLNSVPSFGRLLAECPLTDDDVPARNDEGLRDLDL